MHVCKLSGCGYSFIHFTGSTVIVGYDNRFIAKVVTFTALVFLQPIVRVATMHLSSTIFSYIYVLSLDVAVNTYPSSMRFSTRHTCTLSNLADSGRSFFFWPLVHEIIVISRHLIGRGGRQSRLHLMTGDSCRELDRETTGSSYVKMVRTKLTGRKHMRTASVLPQRKARVNDESRYKGWRGIWYSMQGRHNWYIFNDIARSSYCGWWLHWLLSAETEHLVI